MARLIDITKMACMRLVLENKMTSMSVSEFKEFIMGTGIIEEDEDEFVIFIPRGEHEFVKGKTYNLNENDDFKGGLNEFIITEDGRIFLSVSLNEKVEIEESEDAEDSQTEAKRHNKIRYDELRVNDVVLLHGANARITKVTEMNVTPSKWYPNEKTIAFHVEPNDEEAENILGKLYSHGNYTGVGCLELELVKRGGIW